MFAHVDDETISSKIMRLPRSPPAADSLAMTSFVGNAMIALSVEVDIVMFNVET